MPYMRTLALLTGESVVLRVPVGWYSVRTALARGMKEVIQTGPLAEARPLADGFAARVAVQLPDGLPIMAELHPAGLQAPAKVTRRWRGGIPVRARPARHQDQALSADLRHGWHLGSKGTYLRAKRAGNPDSDLGAGSARSWRRGGDRALGIMAIRVADAAESRELLAAIREGLHAGGSL